MTSRLRRGLGSASVVLLLGATFAACGDSDDSGDGNDNRSGNGGDTASQEAQAPEDADLEGALLPSSEIPEGFESIEPDDDEDDDDPDLFDGTCLDDVGEFDDKVGDPDAEAKAEYEESGAELPASIELGISYYGDDVAQDFADFVVELGQCSKILSTVDGVTIDLAVTEEDFPADGADDSSKLTMTGTLSAQGTEFPLSASIVAILEGRYVTTVSTFEFEDRGLGAEVDDWSLQQLENVLDLG